MVTRWGVQAMKFRGTHLVVVLLVLGLASGHLISAAEPMATKPNIVLFLADDLGGTDLGCYGADLIESPHLDQLAKEGVRFTRAYSPSPVCTPTRASIMTGKHPARLQMTTWSEGSLKGPTDRKLLQAKSQHDLPHTETTLAKHLQQAGYFTALVGKWHLGDAGHFPETHGFDINIGGNHWGAPFSFFWPYRGAGKYGGEFRYVPHLEYGKPGEYLTDRLTDEALKVLDHIAATSQPFFLYLAHHAPHTPIEAKEADIKYFEAKLRPELKHQNAAYAAMVKSMDDGIGRVLDHLKTLKLDQNTIVIFASDNGGYIRMSDAQKAPITNNSPLRSGKGSLYEGGVRVPLIVKWPRITPTGAECHEPVVLTDLFPTLLGAVGLPSPENQPPDGLDLAPVLKKPDTQLDRDTMLFHFPHYYHAPPTTPCSSIVVGPWKLIEYYEDSRVELYNLSDAPSEERDLAGSMPDKAAQLREQLRTRLKSVNAAMPTSNPEYKK